MLLKLRRLRWFIFGRLKIKKQIAEASAKGAIKIILGAGDTRYDGWIATDLPHFNILNENDWHYIFRNYEADNLLVEHVFEHLTKFQVKTVLQFCHTWLKPGGCLRIAVPDSNHPDANYLKLTLPPADDHQSSWNIDSFTTLLKECGFKVVPLEYYSGNKQLCTFGIDEQNGQITRSIQKGYINSNVPGYSSLIIDAFKVNEPAD